MSALEPESPDSGPGGLRLEFSEHGGQRVVCTLMLDERYRPASLTLEESGERHTFLTWAEAADGTQYVRSSREELRGVAFEVDEFEVNPTLDDELFRNPLR